MEVTRSNFSPDETEKGIHTPIEGTTDDTRLSTIHDDDQIPPMDGGLNAWLFLAACFAMEALVWGFAFTYGVFQAYYSDIPQFKDSGNIAVVGTCAMVRTEHIKSQDISSSISRESCTLTFHSSLPLTDNGRVSNVWVVVSVCS